mmetsp:Transcript_40062/g.73208  ORF Transcript_40062/g.73208 Transcript_40062/m.73208 type:complete len:242 (+) Transcript_40062:1935-2660(+)
MSAVVSAYPQSALLGLLHRHRCVADLAVLSGSGPRRQTTSCCPHHHGYHGRHCWAHPAGATWTTFLSHFVPASPRAKEIAALILHRRGHHCHVVTVTISYRQPDVSTVVACCAHVGLLGESGHPNSQGGHDGYHWCLVHSDQTVHLHVHGASGQEVEMAALVAKVVGHLGHHRGNCHGGCHHCDHQGGYALRGHHWSHQTYYPSFGQPADSRRGSPASRRLHGHRTSEGRLRQGRAPREAS